LVFKLNFREPEDMKGQISTRREPGRLKRLAPADRDRLATGGLKVKELGRLKVNGRSCINAKIYMNPEVNGLTCLEK
jgi:hypothetical protein